MNVLPFPPERRLAHSSAISSNRTCHNEVVLEHGFHSRIALIMPFADLRRLRRGQPLQLKIAGGRLGPVLLIGTAEAGDLLLVQLSPVHPLARRFASQFRTEFFGHMVELDLRATPRLVISFDSHATRDVRLHKPALRCTVFQRLVALVGREPI